MNDILLYTEKMTDRVQYSIKVLIELLLNLEVTIVEDKLEFSNSSSPKINYSNHPTTAIEFQIPTHPLPVSYTHLTLPTNREV